jgi:cytochrome c oxidase cbb3-type subunit III
MNARRRALAVIAPLACALIAWGCEREARRFRKSGVIIAPSAVPQNAALRAGAAPISTQSHAERLRALALRHGEHYQHNAWAIGNGKRLFSWFNCTGCHGQGGGGSGPPLMDSEWIYGHDAASIAQSIVLGRPNGMPAFGGKLSYDQVFQLAAYVRSLAGLVPMDAAPGRADMMNVKDPELMMPAQPPRRQRGDQP